MSKSFAIENNDAPDYCPACGSENVHVAYGTVAYCYCDCGLRGKEFSGRLYAEWIDRVGAVKWWNELPRLPKEDLTK